jgi:hypothetical protein
MGEIDQVNRIPHDADIGMSARRFARRLQTCFSVYPAGRAIVRNRCSSLYLRFGVQEFIASPRGARLAHLVRKAGALPGRSTRTGVSYGLC